MEKYIFKESSRHDDTIRRGAVDAALDDLSNERREDDHSEADAEVCAAVARVDLAMPDVRDVMEGNAKASIGDDLGGEKSEMKAVGRREMKSVETLLEYLALTHSLRANISSAN